MSISSNQIYDLLRDSGRVNRQADYAIDVAHRAWNVVSKIHPAHFLVPIVSRDGKTQRMLINPFESIQRADYYHDTAVPGTREEAFRLTTQLEADGHLAVGMAAIICFAWLQRPEDARIDRVTWTDYRPPSRPRKVCVVHHKTGKRVWQPLDDVRIDEQSGEELVTQLYPELEEMLKRLPRLGVPMIMFTPKRGPKDASGNRTPRLYSEPFAQHLVQTARANAGLPKHVTLEGCRHGGMTELGDAELTEQEIMSVSGHATPSAARLYVKRTAKQRLSAAIKRRKLVSSGTKAG